MVRENIENINPYKPGKPIEEVQRELGLKEITKLASNENPLGVSPKAVEAMRKSLGEVNRYPDGNSFYLRDKLARKLNIKPANIVFGNGSNEIIELSVKAFLYEHEQAIMSSPDFLIFKLAVLQEAGKPREVSLDNFYCNLKGILEAVCDKTKMVFIANPNNPVGTYIKEKGLEDFLNKLPEGIVVVLDEAYYEFARDAEGYPDSLRFLERPNVIILRTFSKAYGLSGLRLGYGLANEGLITALNKARQPFNVNYLAQAAGYAALDDDEFLQKTLKINEEGKIFIYSELNEMGLDYIPSATNFIMFNVKREADAVFQEMLKAGVIVRSMASYKLNSWIRVTVGTKDENQRFVDALRKVVKGEKL
ncbi:MAG: histidinol-phosphate transaminase [Candidatus Omnitrophica bacterium]|nr:histidinol-phosphate transaminase [Candidatus Omnitrophota bacterium]